MQPKILSINISRKKGERKKPANEAVLEPGGIVGDGHFGSKNFREISILDWSSVEKLVSSNPDAKIHISYGDFAENITAANLDIKNISVGDTLIISRPNGKPSGDDEVILKISAIGKECHNNCAIKDAMGDCVMPREGIFASVIKGGRIKSGYEIKLIKKTS